MKPKRLAVMGSCLTRDVFNSRFNLNYKHYFECVLTQNQTSFISLMSPPVEYDKTKIDNLISYNEWNVHTDLNKEFLHRIVELKPDALLIDFFADIFFGVLKLREGVYITNNRWKLWKTSYYRELPEKHELNLSVDPEAYMRLWEESIDRFFDYIRSRLPDLDVIVVESRFVDHFASTKDQLLLRISDYRKEHFNVDHANRFMKRMCQYAVDRHGARRLDMTQEHYHSFDQHIWGPFYVHYTMDYYQNALHRLVELLGLEKEKIRIVVFGTGSGAVQFMQRIKQDAVAVQCFVDNDPARQQSGFMGYRVIAPDELPGLEHDCIIIASQFSPDIMKQLLALGIPYDKIVPFYYAHHNRMMEKYHRAVVEQVAEHGK